MFNKGDLVRVKVDCPDEIIPPYQKRYLSDKIWEVDWYLDGEVSISGIYKFGKLTMVIDIEGLELVYSR